MSMEYREKLIMKLIKEVFILFKYWYFNRNSSYTKTVTINKFKVILSKGINFPNVSKKIDHYKIKKKKEQF